ncbi:MAG: TIGR03087 family PEP-CTERM/XrtA system glycosyltransferase [Erythrobacter sp.]
MAEILFLAHRVPFPPNRGDKIRAHHILAKLATLGPVHVGCFAEDEKDRVCESDLAAAAKSHCLVDRRKPLALAGVEAVLSHKPVSLTAFHSNRLESWVKQTLAANPIDTIFVFSGQMGQYIPADFRGRVIVDLCDVDSAKFESYAEAGERVWLNAREGRLLAREEERLGRRSDAAILISENEAELYQSRLQKPDGITVQAVGNGIDAQFFDPKKAQPHHALSEQIGPHFVYTGQMDYLPNVQAAAWIIEAFLPAIRTKFPDAEFHVVGRNPAAQLLKQKDRPGVTIWGEVADVRPFLTGADMVLAPLTIARGVQNKVLEAMAMARPVMLTTQAATGISAEDGTDWMIARAHAEEMCKRAAAAFENTELLDSMCQSARQFVLNHHDWDAVLQPLETLVQPMLQPSNQAMGQRPLEAAHGS